MPYSRFWRRAPYALAFGEAFYEPNVIFTLLLGLVAVWFYDRGEGFVKWIVPLAAAALAEFTRSDHGSFGVFMVFLFFVIKPLNKKLLAAGALVVLTSALYSLQQGAVTRYTLIFLFYLMPIALLYFYDGKKGPGGRFSKWFFYIFYPLHLALLWLFGLVL